MPFKAHPLFKETPVAREILRRGKSGKDGVEYLEVNGLLFELDFADFSKQTTDERAILCKPVSFLEQYLKLFSEVTHARILEFGMWQGGSALFFASALKGLEKFVSVDYRPPNQALNGAIRRHGLRDKIKLYYNTRQDSLEVAAIAHKELGGRPDVVIDDCSHLYGPTRATFEMIFPMLAPGGLYIIEDWGWAHWPGSQGPGARWADEPALTTLMFELIALQGTHSDWIQKIEFYSDSLMVIHKGHEPVDTPLDVTAATLTRGKTIQPI